VEPNLRLFLRKDAIYNAGRFYKEAEVDAIKLEGGRRNIKQIEGIVDAGISVMGKRLFNFSKPLDF